MNLTDIPQIAKLSVPEKILLVEDLWDSIARDDKKIPMPESHKKELDARFARHSVSPGELLTLEELKDRIEARKK